MVATAVPIARSGSLRLPRLPTATRSAATGRHHSGTRTGGSGTGTCAWGCAGGSAAAGRGLCMYGKGLPVGTSSSHLLCLQVCEEPIL